MNTANSRAGSRSPRSVPTTSRSTGPKATSSSPTVSATNPASRTTTRPLKSPVSDLTTSTDSVPVRESYVNYEPPPDAASTVRMLLRYVPHKYLGGLAEVLLTNSGSSRELRRSKTRSRNRTMPLTEALGLYRRRWKGQTALIVIHVDRHDRYERSWGVVG